MEIKWTDVDPDTQERRFLRAERFAQKWRFAFRAKRGEQWDWDLTPTVAMWEHILDLLERKYRRRDGVSDEDLAEVKALVANARRKQATEKG